MVLGPTLDVPLKRASKSKEQFINLGFLNTFNRLEELYLERVFIGKRQTLQLPKIKVLSIELDLTAEYEINSRLDKLPRLVLRSKVQRLFCKGLTTYYLVIEYPECVKSIWWCESDFERMSPDLVRPEAFSSRHAHRKIQTNLPDHLVAPGLVK